MILGPRDITLQGLLTKTNDDTFLVIPHKGPFGRRTFLAAPSVCPNPACDCEEVHLDIYDQGFRSVDEDVLYSFAVQLKKRELSPEQTETPNLEDLYFAKSFLAELTNDDWVLLFRCYCDLKGRRASSLNFDQDYDFVFPLEDIQNNLMVAYQSVVKHAPLLEIFVGKRLFLIDDNYCLSPGCACSNMVLTVFYWEGPKKPFSSSVRFDYKTAKSSIQESHDLIPTEQIIEKLRNKNHRSFFEKRHHFLKRQFALFLRKRNLLENKNTTSQTKVGRNDPCPCGSGKKFKKCCANKIIPLVSEEPWKGKTARDKK